MLYCPNCKGPLAEQDEYLLCTLCCASFRRTNNKVQFFYQFTGNKHIRAFMEVLSNEMHGVTEEAETENDSGGEEDLESIDNAIHSTSNENES